MTRGRLGVSVEMKLCGALRDLLASGRTTVSAAEVATVLWPNGRTNNSRGQTFHLCAGVAGRMLRNSRAAIEVRKGRWEIVPEFLPR